MQAVQGPACCLHRAASLLGAMAVLWGRLGHWDWDLHESWAETRCQDAPALRSLVQRGLGIEGLSLARQGRKPRIGAVRMGDGERQGTETAR